MFNRIGTAFTLAAVASATIPEETENYPVAFANIETFEFGAEAAENTCNSSIERALVGPYDWRKIVGSGQRFNDDVFFPANKDMIVWSTKRRGGGANLDPALAKLEGFYSPLERDSRATLFGNGISPAHIIQGSIGDCYMISALASMAEYPDRVMKLFRTTELN